MRIEKRVRWFVGWKLINKVGGILGVGGSWLDVRRALQFERQFGIMSLLVAGINSNGVPGSSIETKKGVREIGENEK